MHFLLSGGLCTIPDMQKTTMRDTGNHNDKSVLDNLLNVLQQAAATVNLRKLTGNFFGPRSTRMEDNSVGEPSSKRTKLGPSNSGDSAQLDRELKMIEEARNAQMEDPHQLWNQNHDKDYFFGAPDVPKDLQASMNINTLQYVQMISQDGKVIDLTVMCFQAVRRRNEKSIRRKFTLYTPEKSTEDAKSLVYWYTADEFGKLNTAHLNHCMQSGAVEDWMYCLTRAAASMSASLSESPSASPSASSSAEHAAAARDPIQAKADAKAAREKKRHEEIERQMQLLLQP